MNQILDTAARKRYGGTHASVPTAVSRCWTQKLELALAIAARHGDGTVHVRNIEPDERHEPRERGELQPHDGGDDVGVIAQTLVATRGGRHQVQLALTGKRRTR